MVELLLLLLVTSVVLTTQVNGRHHSPPSFRREIHDTDITHQLNEFSLDFYRRVARTTNDNVLFSPFSIYTGFTMLGLGARGNTKHELSKALKWGGNLENVIEKLKPLYEELVKRNDYEKTRLEIANRLWVSNDVKVSRDYRRMLYYYFQTRIGRKAFKSNHEQARRNINNWIAHKTNKNIRHMFPVRSISPLTRMVFANAIHFQGDWAQPFDVKDTKRGKFFLENGQKIDVDYMKTEDKFPAYFDEKHNVQLVEIPYSGNRYSMVLVLPELTDLKSVENSISADTMNEWITTLTSRTALWSSKFIHLPKFELEQSLPLTELLQTFSVRDIFRASRADLSGITGLKTLFVSNALHKASIKVDEKGTVSSAATGIGITMLSYPMTIRFERPFLFYIIHRRSKTIVFSGKMKNPRQTKSYISPKDVTMETNDVTEDLKIDNNIEEAEKSSSSENVKITNSSATNMKISILLVLTPILSMLLPCRWR